MTLFQKVLFSNLRTEATFNMQVIFLGTSAGWPLSRLGFGYIAGIHEQLEKTVQKQAGHHFHIAYDGLELTI